MSVSEPLLDRPVPHPSDGARAPVRLGQIRLHKGVGLLVEAALALYRARNDIRSLGYVEDIPGLLASADIHGAPSVGEEPFGLAVVEAKLAGIPSVILASGGVTELVEHSRGGWVSRAKTAEPLREDVEHVLYMGAVARREVGKEARALLDRLGITKEAYAQAWKRTCEETR